VKPPLPLVHRVSYPCTRCGHVGLRRHIIETLRHNDYREVVIGRICDVCLDDLMLWIEGA